MGVENLPLLIITDISGTGSLDRWVDKVNFTGRMARTTMASTYKARNMA